MTLSELTTKLSSLDASRAQLDSSISSVWGWLIAFTAIVAVGLIFEYWEDFHEILHARPIHWTKFLAIGGAILVTIGVVGEFWEEYRTSDLESTLRTVNADTEKLLFSQAADALTNVAALQKEAAQLSADAAKARSQQEQDHKIAEQAAAHAADLGVTVDNLRGFVAQKEKDADQQLADFKKFAEDEKNQTTAVIAQLNSDEANLRKARDDAQAAATAAEAERAAIEAANKPRDMTADQQSDFIAKMKPFAGLIVNVLTPVQNSADAGPLGTLLVNLLKEAGWKVGYGAPGGGWAKAVLVCVGTKPKDNVSAATQAMVLALRADNIKSFGSHEGPNIPLNGFGATLPNPDMTILVGSK
jgi:hypothetical protein